MQMALGSRLCGVVEMFHTGNVSLQACKDREAYYDGVHSVLYVREAKRL